MPTTNFSNESSSLQNVTCDVHWINSFPVNIVKILLYSIILLSSLVGNALIITIVRKRKELRNTINYFIVNMAVSDFVFPLTVIPVQLTQIATSSMQWRITGTAGLIFCKLIKFLEYVSIIVSVQSLVWIALDRFVAVVLPMKVHLISSRFRVFAIASTWVVAMITNSPILYAYQLVENDGETFCRPGYDNSFSFITYLRVGATLFLILPLVAMTILYCVIAVTLRRQDKVLQCSSVHQKDQRKRRAIKMSLCVMAGFYICFLPALFISLIVQYHIAVSCLLLKVLWFKATLLGLLSSTINPVICMAFVQSFRREFMRILNLCCRKRLTTYNTNSKEKFEQEKITLQNIRVTAREENLTFSKKD